MADYSDESVSFPTISTMKYWIKIFICKKLSG